MNKVKYLAKIKFVNIDIKKKPPCVLMDFVKSHNTRGFSSGKSAYLKGRNIEDLRQDENLLTWNLGNINYGKLIDILEGIELLQNLDIKYIAQKYIKSIDINAYTEKTNNLHKVSLRLREAYYKTTEMGFLGMGAEQPIIFNAYGPAFILR